MTYAEKLKDPRWQKKRLEILDRDEFCCQKCGDTETELQVHHKKYFNNPWDAKSEDLITLCKICHNFFENTKGHLSINEIAIQKLPHGSLKTFIAYYNNQKGRGVVIYSYKNDELSDCIFLNPDCAAIIKDVLNTTNG